MKNIKFLSTTLVLIILSSLALNASESYHDKVMADAKKFQEYFKKKFPNIEEDDYKNGVYAIDSASRAQWEQIEEFPPYELNVDNGKALFETPFKNGKTYAECFENGGIGIANKYPMYDNEAGEVLTIELLINRCREANGEKPLKYKTGDLGDISAYLHYTARGKPYEITVDSQDAYDAYMSGKKFFYSKRGQLNFSCADCHMSYSGMRLRADILSPALGHSTGFPVYRSKWNSLGTMHRRYGGCNKNIRAKEFAPQSTEYRELQYFHTLMSVGQELNGPSARK